MRVALVQTNPIVGDIEYNYRLHVDAINRAEEEGIDLLVFPELSITGYPPKDLLRYDAFVIENERCLMALLKHTKKVGVVAGFVERNPGPYGAPFYNCAAVLAGGKILRVYHKRLLPTYDVFDERRYFEPGTHEPAIVKFKDKRIGLCVCEDAWNFPGHSERLYKYNPLEELAREKPDFVVNISASPFSIHKPAKRLETFRLAVRLLKCPIVVTNQVGGNDELLFDGGSLALNGKGELVDIAASFKEDFLVVDTKDFEGSEEITRNWPGEQESLVSALTMGLSDYCRKSRLDKIVLGLSGGIDSAVAAVISAKSIGPENVTGISLPTRFTAEDSTSAAKQLAKNLGIHFKEFPVESLFETYEAAITQWLGEPLKGITSENLQPRIRMAILMAYANQHGMLLVNTSNKSEIATGYATLYGDAAGGISILGDLTKGQVYSVANYVNRLEGETVPNIIIERAPTAELREGQKDEDSLPPYDVLDEMVRLVVERGHGSMDLIKEGIDKKWVKVFEKLHSISEYKRYQLPPALRVSETGFGIGRRIPIASAKPFLLSK